jgi:hypothetical protein
MAPRTQTAEPGYLPGQTDAGITWMVPAKQKWVEGASSGRQTPIYSP